MVTQRLETRKVTTKCTTKIQDVEWLPLDTGGQEGINILCHIVVLGSLPEGLCISIIMANGGRFNRIKFLGIQAR